MVILPHLLKFTLCSHSFCLHNGPTCLVKKEKKTLFSHCSPFCYLKGFHIWVLFSPLTIAFFPLRVFIDTHNPTPHKASSFPHELPFKTHFQPHLLSSKTAIEDSTVSSTGAEGTLWNSVHLSSYLTSILLWKFTPSRMLNIVSALLCLRRVRGFFVGKSVRIYDSKRTWSFLSRNVSHI